MRRPLLALAALGPLAVVSAASAKMMMMEDLGPPSFALSIPAPFGDRPAPVAAAFLTTSTIAAVGDGALVIDADSGDLVLTDAHDARVAALPIGAGAGLLAYDPVAGRAYVADRRGDHVVVIAVGAPAGTTAGTTAGTPATGTLAEVARWATPAEPYGVALTPDRATVVVTTIADRTLVALDAATGAERWRAALPAEPRGLAIAPDGGRAMVSSLAVGDVTAIELAGAHAVAARLLPASGERACRRHCKEPGSVPSFARGAFAVTFVGPGQVVVPFQREVPVQTRDRAVIAHGYGGGLDAPITQRLALLGAGTATGLAEVAVHQPRALAWDGARDRLYVAGLGSDTLLALRAASTARIALDTDTSLATAMPDGSRCGPDGVAIGAGDTVLIWCSLARVVLRVRFPADAPAGASPAVARGPELTTSRLDAAAQLGRQLFHIASPAISQGGALACASCHPDGRTDGLSWRIDRHELQTPILAGRVSGTHPFKWDGTDADLATSVTSTMKRLGGGGLDQAQTQALVAYLDAQPAPRAPTRDATAVARGAALFDAAKVGCRSCHDGDAYTDQDAHRFRGTLAQTDTPSLRGLAASAPYYHDGSAPTLTALLRGAGRVHGMPLGKRLSAGELADLVAFLETR